MKTSLGRGTLYLMVAQVVFLISGYLIHIGLGRYLGPREYGIFGVIIALITTINIILTSGMPQAVSKFIAENEKLALAIKNKALKIHGIFILIIFALYFLLADQIADLLNDPCLVPYIRLSAFIIPGYAFYSIYLGCLNGLRYFGGQAKTSIIYSMAKVFGVFTLVLFGLRINGAIFGYLIAPLIGLVVGRHYMNIKNRGGNFKTERIIRFAIPVIIFSVAATLLTSIDIFSVKSMLMDDAEVGFYNAASVLAKLPYFILGVLGSTLLPSISRSTSRGDRKQTQVYIRNSLRYLLIILIPVILLISATSKELISLLYSSVYIPGASALSILIFGQGFLTIFMIIATIITASGKPQISMGIVLLLVPIDLILNIILIPMYRLEGAAMATTISIFIGLVIAGGYVLKRFGVLMEFISFIKISLASIIIYLIVLNISISDFLLPIGYMVLTGIYLLILILLKEINKEDIKTIKKMIPERYQELLPGF